MIQETETRYKMMSIYCHVFLFLVLSSLLYKTKSEFKKMVRGKGEKVFTLQLEMAQSSGTSVVVLFAISHMPANVKLGRPEGI